MKEFEEQLREDLHQFLVGIKAIDERLPECPDVEDKWEETARAYLPDGIREYKDYPTVFLGWMMYIGMALAKLWDLDIVALSKEDLYVSMREKRGFDYLDEYIHEEVLLLNEEDSKAMEKMVGECASRIYNALMRQRIEPGTKEAFHAYVACIHQLYLMGVAIQLNRMGYHMTQL